MGRRKRSGLGSLIGGFIVLAVVARLIASRWPGAFVLCVVVFLCIFGYYWIKNRNPEKSFTIRTEIRYGEAEADETGRGIVGHPPPIAIKIPTFEGLPSKPLSVKSHSEIGTSYIIDLREMTCTCPDFLRRRVEQPADDIRRLCKHLGAELFKKKYRDQLDELTFAILMEGARESEWSKIPLPSGMDIFAGYREGSQWVSVLTRDRGKGETGANFTGPFRRYGYNLVEKRWSYGVGPDGATVIKQALHDNFTLG